MADRVRPGLDGRGRIRGLAIAMHTHLPKIMPETRLHLRAQSGL